MLPHAIHAACAAQPPMLPNAACAARSACTLRARPALAASLAAYPRRSLYCPPARMTHAERYLARNFFYGYIYLRSIHLKNSLVYFHQAGNTQGL
jgi:hypothetical protein